MARPSGTNSWTRGTLSPQASVPSGSGRRWGRGIYGCLLCPGILGRHSQGAGEAAGTTGSRAGVCAELLELSGCEVQRVAAAPSKSKETEWEAGKMIASTFTCNRRR